jgi:hypothetical protein
MRVMPPTRMTSSMSALSRPASSSVISQISMVRSDQILGELLELAAREQALEVQRLVARARDDERQVHLGLDDARELALGLLRGVLEALEGHAVLAEVDVVLVLEARDEPVDDALVEVLAAEERVARGGDHLEHARRADLQDGDVERAAAEVVDRDGLVDVLAEAVGEGRGRGLVDDADDVEPGDRARVLGGLALAVVEVRGDRHDALATSWPR